MSRMGKHSGDKCFVGIYASRHHRTILELVANHLGLTMTDVILECVNNRARELGLISEGKINDTHVNEYRNILNRLAKNKA